MVGKMFARKKLFVNAGIQGTLSLRFCAYWAVYHLSLWHAAFIYFFIRERLGQLTGQSQMRSIDQLYTHFLSEYAPLTAGACLMLPIVIHELVRQTHRVAGPMVRFSSTMRDMIAGKDVQPIKLRDGDLMKDFEKLFNEFIVIYQSRKSSPASESLDVPGAGIDESIDESRQLVASNAAM